MSEGKPRIAVYKFSSCDGCQLSLLNLEDELLELVGAVEIALFLEARRRGLHPFCVTIDQQAHAYLPHVFGRHHFAVVRNAAELPQRLALLYARLRR